MNILLIGFDGYIGWPLAIELLKAGHKVMGYDNYSRRQRVGEIGSDSLTPIQDPVERIEILKTIGDFHLTTPRTSYESKLDTIIHLGQQPSAPFSMISQGHAMETQVSNTIGNLNLLYAIKENCPNVHLIKLGSMGEYGTPQCKLPEGEVPATCMGEADCECPMSGMIFPRTGISFDHLSKIFDAYYIEFASRNWGITATDIQQGIVYGVTTEATSNNSDLLTRFDYDYCCGTAVNRFVAQAISNNPITVYGSGNQTKSFLPLQDSINCIKLLAENPPAKGEFRTINQFAEVATISDLAHYVKLASESDSPVENLANPRTEIETTFYQPANSKLTALGYKPSKYLNHGITELSANLKPYADRVNSSVLAPVGTWKD